MANISISSPFIRSPFVHADINVGSVSAGTVLSPAPTPQRRILVIIQNKSTTASVQVIFNVTSGQTGIYVPPLGSISIDNYNGGVRVLASAELTPIHVAYAIA